MKKKLTRIVSLILAVLALAALASCAGDGGEKGDTGTAQAPAEASASGNRIYFASPLFSEGEREYNLKIVEVLEKHGYEVFLPQRDGFLAPDLEGLTEEEKVRKIFAKDVEEVLRADIFFFLLDGRVPDEGACIEMGIAYANEKRCYGMKSDARTLESDMDLNPMLTGCFRKIFYDLDGEARLRSLEEYLKENPL